MGGLWVLRALAITLAGASHSTRGMAWRRAVEGGCRGGCALAHSSNLAQHSGRQGAHHGAGHRLGSRNSLGRSPRAQGQGAHTKGVR
jgi:hypothetical protein